MNTSDCDVVIVAQGPDALVKLCGITLLERLLRNLRRIGIHEATIVSTQPELFAEELAKPSWPRSGVAVRVHAVETPMPSLSALLALTHRPHVLVISAGYYIEPRLVSALLRADRSAALVDSRPPDNVLSPSARTARPLPGAVINRAATAAASHSGVFEWLATAVAEGSIEAIDVEQQDRYLVDLRRSLRPIWFPAPSAEHRKTSENVLLNAAQNGTLDLPAMLHGPLETAIIRRLCRTRITPMQITLFTAAVSVGVTALFASGRLVAGTILALIVGLLDGLDGKQARVKVETTELGKREHLLDYVLELSWWIALAYHFASSGALPTAYPLVLLLVGSDVVDRYAKRIAKHHTGRNLDDVAPIDRFVRLIGGRRNIYIWIFAIGLAAGAADKAFAFFCYWGAGTAAVHVVRAYSIARQRRAV